MKPGFEHEFSFNHDALLSMALFVKKANYIIILDVVFLFSRPLLTLTSYLEANSVADLKAVREIIDKR